jgi:Leucine-rich repeat (LRR) protein
MILNGQLEQVARDHTRLELSLDRRIRSIHIDLNVGGATINHGISLDGRCNASDRKFLTVNLRSRGGHLNVEATTGEQEPERRRTLDGGNPIMLDSKFVHPNGRQAQLLVDLSNQLRSVSANVSIYGMSMNVGNATSGMSMVNCGKQFLIVRLRSSADGKLFVEIKSSRCPWPGPNRVLDRALLEQIVSNSTLGLAQLGKLDLSNFSIESIDDDAFVGLDRLKVLVLSGNKISDIGNNGGLFRNLSGLKILDLSFNRLIRINVGDFDGLANLSHLELDGNELERLDANVFSELRALETLNLEKCQLTRLHANAFIGLTSLKELILKKCDLGPELDPLVFRNLHSLNKLDLSGNRRLNGRMSASLLRELNPECSLTY